METKHHAMVGFVESRLSQLAQLLESELRVDDCVLIDANSPYTLE